MFAASAIRSQNGTLRSGVSASASAWLEIDITWLWARRSAARSAAVAIEPSALALMASESVPAGVASSASR